MMAEGNYLMTKSFFFAEGRAGQWAEAVVAVEIKY
jgi:hypothetical protein